jgi:hypothetical protein
MTRTNLRSIVRPPHALSSASIIGRALASALMVAGLATTLAACAGDYEPATSGAIQSDIDSSRWLNQLPPQAPDTQSQSLVQSPLME